MAIALLIFAPAVISIFYALYSVIRWMMSRRSASTGNHLLAGLMGPFAIFAPKLIDEQSKHHFIRFLFAICFFISYCGLLLALFK